MAISTTAVLRMDQVDLCGFMVYVDVMALQIQRQQVFSVPAAEKGLGPAAASLADARVPWICAGGPGMKPVPAQASRVTMNT